MACSPTSIENQIDSFLEQFKRSASRAMEETHHHHQHHQRSSIYNASSISRSRSGNLDLEVLEVGKSAFVFIFFLSQQWSNKWEFLSDWKIFLCYDVEVHNYDEQFFKNNFY